MAIRFLESFLKFTFFPLDFNHHMLSDIKVAMMKDKVHNPRTFSDTIILTLVLSGTIINLQHLGEAKTFRTRT
jgi:hypothetical protein